jgi:hypothetical protein
MCSYLVEEIGMVFDIVLLIVQIGAVLQQYTVQGDEVLTIVYSTRRWDAEVAPLHDRKLYMNDKGWMLN